MKKLSMRLRLTLFIVLLLAGVCVILTLLSLYNANNSFVIPYVSASAPDVEVEELEFSQKASVSASEQVTAEGEKAQAGMIQIVASSSASFNAASLWAMIAVIGGGGLLAYFLLGRALKPLQSLSEEISAITENELSQRIGPSGANDEISSLADSFNTMLSRLEKAFSDQKRFSSDAAHELKTPLAAIKTNIDVLRLEEKPTGGQYEQTINIVGKQTERMIRLVDDLFTMSSQRDYDFRDAVQFDSMFRDIIAQLGPRIAEKNLAVNVEPGGYTTTGNSVMLMRAFSNLVENAVKYNTDGGSIAISCDEDDKNYIFTIADTGIGIPEEKQGDIFKPFYRADDSRSRKIGGAGLGLAIAKDIIERHGGEITVSSGENGGTVFTVKLPKIPAQ